MLQLHELHDIYNPCSRIPGIKKNVNEKNCSVSFNNHNKLFLIKKKKVILQQMKYNLKYFK